MHVAIIGGGSIGSYITAKFANNANYKVTLVARSSYGVISTNGIRVDEAHDNSTFLTSRFTVTDDFNLVGFADFVIIAIRTSQNTQLTPLLHKLCHDRTTVVTLQNGLDFEDSLANAIVDQRLYSGTCWIKVTTLKPGHIRHDFGTNIKLGHYISGKSDVPISVEDQVVSDVFKNVGLAVDLVSNVKSVQLTKLALNIPFFMLSAAKHKSFSEILHDPILDKKRIELEREIIPITI